MRRGGLGAALLALLLALAPGSAAPQAQPPPGDAGGRFLIVSDIHFDALAAPAVVDRLAAAPPREWRAILDGAPDPSLGRYGFDTPWPLLRSALRAMRAALPRPAFVLVPGDFLAHRFRRRFDAAAARHGDADYRAFVAKTMRFLARQLRATFPGVPILVAPGNNDSDCGDYAVAPGGPFFAATLPAIADLAAGAAGRDLARDWTALGDYVATPPGLPHLRLLLFDDVFWSPRYRNACGAAATQDPGRASLAWLERQLAEAAAAGARVWLVLHIPPGVDPYATLRRGACRGAIATMWAPAYAEAFRLLLHRYRATVAAILAGHTHMDDFRLLDRDGFVLITPALSPIFGQNPAFRVVGFDAAGTLGDTTVWGLTNFADAAGGAAVAPVWAPEYSFAANWRLSAVDGPGLARLAAMVAASPADRARWQRFYAVSSPVFWPLQTGLGEENAIRAYRCAEEYSDIPGFRRCYCGQ